MSAQNSE